MEVASTSKRGVGEKDERRLGPPWRFGGVDDFLAPLRAAGQGGAAQRTEGYPSSGGSTYFDLFHVEKFAFKSCPQRL